MLDTHSISPDDAEVLRHLLEVALDTSATDALLFAGAEAALRQFAAALFMIDVRPGVDVLRFLDQGLNRICQHMTRIAERKVNTYHGQVRGHIAWSTTYKTRLDKDYDPSLYVCFEQHNRYNTPENQLVKLLVEHIAHTHEMIPAPLRDGICYSPAASARAPALLIHRWREVALLLDRFERNIYMRTVALPEQINAQHLVRTSTAKLVEYVDAARLYTLLTQRVLTTDLTAVKQYIGEVTARPLPLPRQVGAESEFWIRCAAGALRVGR